MGANISIPWSDAERELQPTELDAFLAAYRRDWIKAGPPSPSVVIAMVNEIDRLRSLDPNRLILELARGIQIAHAAWVAAGAPGAWNDAGTEP